MNNTYVIKFKVEFIFSSQSKNRLVKSLLFIVYFVKELRCF